LVVLSLVPKVKSFPRRLLRLDPARPVRLGIKVAVFGLTGLLLLLFSWAGFEAKADESTLPIIGRVAAGAPILAQQHVEESCNINPTFFHPRADYLLRVHGMSMKDVGIFDGDLLAVHTTREARNGQIVVARIGDEVTVKRFKREGSKVWLLAENPEFAPIEVNLKDQDLVIEGLSVGVIRR
jgi:repressor LexA